MLHRVPAETTARNTPTAPLSVQHTQNSADPGLADLPLDLRECVAGHLDLRSYLAVRGSCRILRQSWRAPSLLAAQLRRALPLHPVDDHEQRDPELLLGRVLDVNAAIGDGRATARPLAAPKPLDDVACAGERIFGLYGPAASPTLWTCEPARMTAPRTRVLPSLAASQATHLEPAFGEWERLRLSSRGTYAVSSDGSNLRLWDIAAGTAARLLPQRARAASLCYGLAFSLDETKVAAVASGGAVQLWNASTASPLQSFKTEAWPKSVTFSPLGDHVCIPTGTGAIRVYNLDAPDARQVAHCLKMTWHAAFNPTDAAIAPGADILCSAALLGGEIYRVAFFPDGKHLAAATGEGLCVIDMKTKTESRLPARGCYGLPLVVTEDGTQIIVGGKVGYVYDFVNASGAARSL